MITQVERGKLNIVSNEVLREATKNVLSDMTAAVSHTLGPSGKATLIHDPYNITSLYPSKDGFQIIQSMMYDNYLYEAIYIIMRDIANHMNITVGDATTSGIPITERLYDYLDSLIQSGFDVNGECAPITPSGMLNILETVAIVMAEKLDKEYVLKLKDYTLEEKYEVVKKVATIAANNDKEIGTYVADLFKNVLDEEKELYVDVDVNMGQETTSSTEVGFEMYAGMISRYYATTSDGTTAIYENPLFFIADGPILETDLPNVNKVIEEVVYKRHAPLIIVASDYSENVAKYLMQLRMGFQAESNDPENPGKVQNVPPMPIVAIQLNSGSELGRNRMMDLEVALGAKSVPCTESKMMDLTQVEDFSSILGSADKIICQAQLTRVIRGHGDKEKIKGRLKLLQEELNSKIMDDAMSSEIHKSLLKKRISMLDSSMVSVKVGGRSHKEKTYKKLVMEDAIYATKNVVANGFTIGGQRSIVKLISLDREWIAKEVATRLMTAGKNVVYGTKKDEKLIAFVERVLDIVKETFETSYQIAISNAIKDPSVIMEIRRTLEENNYDEKTKPCVYNIMTDAYEYLSVDSNCNLIVAGGTDIELMKTVFATVSLFLNSEFMMGYQLLQPPKGIPNNEQQ